MTATSSSSSSATGAGSRRGPTIAVVVVVVIALLVIGRLTAETRTDVPYDPTSTSPSGTKALVELAGEFGADVAVPDAFPVDADVAVLFQDVVPPSQVEAVRDWVRQGHTLVVTDPTSDFTPEATFGENPSPGGLSATLEPGRCTIEALADVGAIQRASASSTYPTFRVVPGDAVCFSQDDRAFVTLTAEGDGRIVSVAAGSLFTNKELGKADNAVLAVDLLAPRPGTKVAVLTTKAFGVGADDGEPADISGAIERVITLGIGLMLLQLLVATALYGMARGRRLGRPVSEPQPVQIAGSELVAAVGNLLQQMKQPGNAAAVLRADLRRTLADRLGLPRDAPAELLADAVAARTGIERDEALAVLVDHPVADDRQLVAVATQIDRIREEILHGHAP